MLRLFRRLFKREITIATYRRKAVDCGIKSDIHCQLAKEMGKPWPLSDRRLM